MAICGRFFLGSGEEGTDDATWGGDFGAGTPAVPASNGRSAPCLTLREGKEEFKIYRYSF
jgi:hypothetical protein